MTAQTVACFLDLDDGRTIGYTRVSWMDDFGDDGRSWMSEWWILVGRKGRGVTQVLEFESDDEEAPQTEDVGGLRGLFNRIRKGKRRRKPVSRLVEREIDILLADETIVVAKGFDSFFQRVLEANGAFFFDEIGAGCPPWREASARLKFER